MNRIRRPMKAPTDPITDTELLSLKYPLCGSPKLDGFRCVVDKVPLTSAMKSFGNEYVNLFLCQSEYDGLDGELIVGSPIDPDVFHNTSGPLRRHSGEPNFTFYVFDNFLGGDFSYSKRWLQYLPAKLPRVVVLEQRILTCAQDVLAYEAEMLSMGFEGAMIRSLSGLYKEGRCTFNEGNIYKRKPFVECEAIIIGFEESMLNLNEKVLDERGLSKRSSHTENKVPKGTLGSFKLISPLWEASFSARAGEGFTQELKQQIWNERESYLGQTATVKYQKYGSRDAPRMPSVIKIRPEWDL